MQSSNRFPGEDVADYGELTGGVEPVQGGAIAKPVGKVAADQRVDEYPAGGEFAPGHCPGPSHVQSCHRHQPTRVRMSAGPHPGHALDNERSNTGPGRRRAIGCVPGDDVPENVGEFRIERAEVIHIGVGVNGDRVVESEFLHEELRVRRNFATRWGCPRFCPPNLIVIFFMLISLKKSFSKIF